MYEDSGIGLEVLGIKTFDTKLSIYYRKQIDLFFEICYKQKFTEEQYKNAKKQFDECIFFTNMQDISEMMITIEEFLCCEGYSVTEEDLIRKHHIPIDFDKNCFMIDSKAFKQKM